jgi:hypothetical protein
VSKTKLYISIALGLVLLAAILRLAPHPPNFAPIAAVAIFGGAMLPRRYGVAVPLAAIIATDFIIGLHDLFLVTWGAYALIALASSLWLREKLTFVRGAAMALGASLFFFVATNFAVWLTSGMYQHTWAGLAQCFTLAIPFFRNTLASDLIYTATLFGLYALAVNASSLAVSRVSLGR